ncbi:MAG: D-aminoacyl-tRNA deacylase [Candidatus Bathyarchaeia archaeon]|nr:D-tyrosyl-tRNA(Tyr) deacylase [Candidatus Bathyarchaeota archaeon]
MVVLITASKKDLAALNIAEKLIHNYGFKKENENLYKGEHEFLALIEEDSLYSENLDKLFNPEAIVFASRHSAETGKPTLTVHVPGNWGSTAMYGGKPEELAVADPKRMKAALLTLKIKKEELNLSEFDVSLEATHHGPTGMNCPVLFVEIGSSMKEWVNPKAGLAVAEAIIAACRKTVNGENCVGFGGGHYARKHTKIVLESNLAVGHILPKFFFEEFNLRIVRKTFERTIKPCQKALIDWKGMRGLERTKLIDFLSTINVEIIKV